MNSRVLLAAQNGDTESIQSLYTENAEFMREVTFEKNNILHIAAREGHLEFVKWVIENVEGSSGMCSALNSDWNMPLHEAAQNGDAPLVKILIKFTKAARSHDVRDHIKLVIQQFEMLFGLNNPIGDLNIMGETPLLIACKNGHEGAVTHLLEASTRIKLWVGRYQPCLHVAAYGGHIGVVKLLLNKINWQDLLFYSDAQGANPLHLAVLGGHLDVVLEILNALNPDKRKLVMKKQDGEGRCPIHVAVVKGRDDIVDNFISSTPDCVEIRSAEGKTVLHFAVEYNRSELVGKLLSVVKRERVPDHFGNTTLHLAAHNAVDPQLMESLLSFPGIDVNAINKEGLTPLDIAIAASSKNSTDEIIQILKCAVDTASSRNSTNETIQILRDIVVAVSSRNSTNEIIRILKEHGAYGKYTKQFYHNYNDLTKSASKQKKEMQNKAMNMDTLVASIIVTVTFAAIFQVPGGLEEDKKSVHYRVAKLAFEPLFTHFLCFDTLALSTSMAVVIGWLFRERLQEIREEGLRYKFVSTTFLGISIFATATAFLCAVYLVIVPPNMKHLKVTNKEAFTKYYIMYVRVLFSTLPMIIALVAGPFYIWAKNIRNVKRGDVKMATFTLVFVMIIMFSIFYWYVSHILG